jgi:cellulose synthase/poly-beta-1,6-N-acetylglucosamine synthase-like glycosyltransferase
VRKLFWLSAAALGWTHVGYPLAAALAARLRPDPVKRGEVTPSVTLIVAAWNEEEVIARRLENLLALDYPADRLEIVVASDASDDGTDAIVEQFAAREPRVRLLRCPRGGKVAAQNRAVAQSEADVVAFSDANCTWAPDALRLLVRSFAGPEVAYVCGKLVVQDADGTNVEGTYWLLETCLRAQEAKTGSITGGNGAIYAVRRTDYRDVDPRFGHDLSLPYLMVQHGRRAAYEPDALAFEKPSRDIEDEYARKVRMFEHCWAIVVEGDMLRGLPFGYLVKIVSHRHLRYGSGVAHLVLLGSSLALARRGGVYRTALLGQSVFLALAALRPGLPRYYTLVTWATVKSLRNYVREGVPAVWEKAEGTR